MKILIKSREQLELDSVNGFPNGTAIISITDIGDAEVNLKTNPDYLLRMEFNDISNDSIEKGNSEKKHLAELYRLGMIRPNQAEEIANFYFSIKNKANTLICQCEHGQSRSAAVAEAILEFSSKKGIDIFSNDRFYPNKVVFREISNALKTSEIERENF